MAKLSNQITATVKLYGEEVQLKLRQPSNAELNDFLSRRYPTVSGRVVQDNSHQARCDFFDRLLIAVDNLEDAAGEKVTLEKKDSIPANWKTSVIFQYFENNEIDIKN